MIVQLTALKNAFFSLLTSLETLRDTINNYPVLFFFFFVSSTSWAHLTFLNYSFKQTQIEKKKNIQSPNNG